MRLGAAQVLIGEGPAIDRDTKAILESIGLRHYTGSLTNVFVDLNVDDVQKVLLPTAASRLRELYLPKAVLSADFIFPCPSSRRTIGGRRNSFFEEHVRHRAGQLLWVAEERAPLGRH